MLNRYLEDYNISYTNTNFRSTNEHNQNIRDLLSYHLENISHYEQLADRSQTVYSFLF